MTDGTKRTYKVQCLLMCEGQNPTIRIFHLYRHQEV